MPVLLDAARRLNRRLRQEFPSPCKQSHLKWGSSDPPWLPKLHTSRGGSFVRRCVKILQIERSATRIQCADGRSLDNKSSGRKAFRNGCGASHPSMLAPRFYQTAIRQQPVERIDPFEEAGPRVFVREDIGCDGRESNFVRSRIRSIERNQHSANARDSASVDQHLAVVDRAGQFEGGTEQAWYQQRDDHDGLRCRSEYGIGERGSYGKQSRFIVRSRNPDSFQRALHRASSIVDRSEICVILLR